MYHKEIKQDKDTMWWMDKVDRESLFSAFPLFLSQDIQENVIICESRKEKIIQEKLSHSL